MLVVKNTTTDTWVEAHIIVRIRFLCLGTEALNLKTVASVEQINLYCGGFVLWWWVSQVAQWERFLLYCRSHRRCGFDPGLGKSPGGGHGNPHHILAWGILWTEESGRLHSIRSQRVGHDWKWLSMQHSCLNPLMPMAFSQLWQLKMSPLSWLRTTGL